MIRHLISYGGINGGQNETRGLILRPERPQNEAACAGSIAGRSARKISSAPGENSTEDRKPLRASHPAAQEDRWASPACGRLDHISQAGTAHAKK